jgi:hypothetical protein
MGFGVLPIIPIAQAKAALPSRSRSRPTVGCPIQQVDDETDAGPAYFMINCVHATHFLYALDPTELDEGGPRARPCARAPRAYAWRTEETEPFRSAWPGSLDER